MIRNILLIALFITTLSSCRRVAPLPDSEIDPGNFYRSGQLKIADLDRLVSKKGIRTIINLRGVHPGEKWFDDEFNYTESKQINFHSLDFELKQLPHRRSLLLLLDILKNAPRPILIHCDNGVERTGEVAAIYEMVIKGKSKAEAMKMLSSKYSYDESDDPSKKYFIETVWKGEDWARNIYNPCKQNYSYYNRKQPECTQQ